jgi:hypothetical protein
MLHLGTEGIDVTADGCSPGTQGNEPRVGDGDGVVFGLNADHGPQG